ncbi:MAG: mechanosensitive ion channel family protein [Candidatus Eremiobacteraeota bacterium]|nr:mechanosensitive ion channel family protein [Candidatus Eremiobacteraeota bacterium]
MLSSVTLIFSPWLPAVNTGQWLTTVIALAVALIVWRLVVAAIDRFYGRRFFSRFIPRVSTYTSLSKSAAGAVILYLVLIELLHIWSVNVAPALWSATLISAAIAFGAQAIVRDVLSGIFFLFEDTYDVGDGVEFTTTNGIVMGTVDAIGLRLTRVVDEQGRAVSIPNGSIVFVTNATRLPSRVKLKIVLPLRADLHVLRKRIDEVSAQAAPEFGIDRNSISVKLEDSGPETVTFGIEFESGRALAGKAEAALREQVLTALQADGVLPGAATPKTGEL